ncbi:MAG: glutaredoxin family protein [Thiobacillus sp.]|nr:glutaredoxin family protein [Thiobacillus sp.]
MSKTLTLYTRVGCLLCEEMAAEISVLIAGTGHRLECVDVDADPSLKTRHGWDVPLLFDGETEICRHQLNLPAFQEWLRANP